MEEEELFNLNDYDEQSENKKSKEGEAKAHTNPLVINSINDTDSIPFGLKPQNNNPPSSLEDQLQPNQSKDIETKQLFAVEDNIDTSEYANISKPAMQYPFELDDFQKRSIIRLKQHKNVLACAHTSSGKTVIAEYGIALAKQSQRRVLYTSPIKALSNQKYREFKKTFGDVGIVTGDVSINSDAQCLVMTTEILQSSLYKNSELLNAVEWVVFDEIHYINDNERGHVWEEILILLPAQIGIIMLSATIPNYMEFAQWVGKIKNTTIYVQNTLRRVVPLEHRLYVDASSVFLVKDLNNKVYAESIDEALKLVKGKDKPGLSKLSEEEHYINGGAQKEKKDKAGQKRFKHRASNNILSKIEEIVLYLTQNSLTPAVIFIFSIKQINNYAKFISKLHLVDKTETQRISSFFDLCISSLSEADKQIPQVTEIRNILISGIGVHHAGLLPILKEIIEVLYSKGLIKILFATTSFSIGLNMPTRTVVFTDVYKYNEAKREILSSSEYLQMCGRAGRRGIDTIGNVFLLFTERNKEKEKTELIAMLNGTGTEVGSKFRLSYRTIISFFSRSIKSINTFFKESFLESINVEQLDALMKEIDEAKKSKEKIECFFQSNSDLIDSYIIINAELRKINSELFKYTPLANRLKNQSRFIEVRDPELMVNLIVLLINYYTNFEGEVWCLRVVRNDQIKYEEKTEEEEGNTYFKGKFKTYRYDYFSYAVEDIVDLYDECLQVKIQVTDDDGYKFIGRPDLIVSIKKLIELNGKEAIKLPLIKYEKLAYCEDNILALLARRRELMKQLSESSCFNCALLKEHSEISSRNSVLSSALKEKMKKINPENMSHYQEFSLRLKILQKLDYIDSNQVITIKGKAAREIATTDCLLVSEVILSNVLEKLPDEELIAFLSCFALNKSDVDNDKDPGVSPSFTEAFTKFNEIYNRIVDLEQENGFEDNKYNRKTSFCASRAMNAWMLGKTFAEIVQETDLEEGKLYNLIMRLYLFIEEIINFYKTFEYNGMIAKFKLLKEKMMRDIMAVQSLYLQETFNIDISL